MEARTPYSIVAFLASWRFRLLIDDDRWLWFEVEHVGGGPELGIVAVEELDARQLHVVVADDPVPGAELDVTRPVAVGIEDQLHTVVRLDRRLVLDHPRQELV